MGGFSNFAVSFSIISILTGAVLLFGYGLKFAGPDRELRRLARRQPAHPDRGHVDGRDCIGLSHRGRPLLLGVPSRRANVGVGHGVAEHDRAGLDHRWHQHRRGDLHHRHLHARAEELVVPGRRHGADSRAAGCHQPLGHPPDGAALGHQRVVAHRRRAAHRAGAHVLRQAPQSRLISLRVEAGRARSGDRGGTSDDRRSLDPIAALPALSLACRPVRRGAATAVLRSRAAAGAMDVHRLRRLGASRRGDRDGAEELGLGDRAVGRRLSDCRLRDADDPDVVHPVRRRARHGERSLSGALHPLQEPHARCSRTPSRSSSAWRCGSAACLRSPRWGGCGTRLRATTECPARAGSSA